MMHEASLSQPSFILPTTLDFGVNARRWHGVLGLQQKEGTCHDVNLEAWVRDSIIRNGLYLMVI